MIATYLKVLILLSTAKDWNNFRNDLWFLTVYNSTTLSHFRSGRKGHDTGATTVRIRLGAPVLDRQTLDGLPHHRQDGNW